jgi:phosphohistidine swiveling domain-containing protein
MKIKGKLLVGSDIMNKKFSYQNVRDVSDFKKTDGIIVDYLSPDFTILLSNISFIISKKGSALSHLAIVAREYGKIIIIIDKITKKIPEKGELFFKFISKENVEIEIY